MGKYTKELLVEELQYFTEYLGRTPTVSEVDKDPLMPCCNTYKRYFGSHNKALIAASITLNRRTEYSVESLLKDLKTLAGKLKHTPTYKELSIDNQTYSTETYRKVFGSYTTACIKAGLKPNCNQSHITEENLALSYNKEWLKKENKTKHLIQISKELGYQKGKLSHRFKELDIKPVLHKESLKEKEWLDSLGITERQYPIANYKVDGYDPETNTVYEFLGDYWHGNPEVYDPDDYNKSCSKTFGQLHNETIERLEHIKSLGYNIIIQWEKEWLI